jgi:toxin FitB
MIILDTNVLSALMLEEPLQDVAAWLDRQPRASVWTTAITIFEMRSGLVSLPIGCRRAMLEEKFQILVGERLEQRVLPFDSPAAEQAAILMGERQRSGRPRDLRDTMIAAIAISQNATLATRNTKHFDDLHVPVVDPWNA